MSAPSDPSDHTAAGQALGFLYQFDRATHLLFAAELTVVEVGIEDIDDVSVHHEDGTTIREQDKSTIGVRRALTDKSAALWKTLANWAEAVSSDPGILSHTQFHLVTNGTILSTGLAAQIGGVADIEVATKLAKDVRHRAERLRTELIPYGSIVRRLQRGTLAQLLTRITVLDRTAARFGGELKALQALSYFRPVEQIALFDQAAAWVQRTLREAVEAGRPARVTRDAFQKQLEAFVHGLLRAPLGSVLVPPPLGPTPSEYATRGFVQQLDWVESNQGLVRESVIHYIQAAETRMRWTDDNMVSEDTLRAYQAELASRWGRICRQVSRKRHDSDIVHGQERLDTTLGEQTMLSGELMPLAITCGNFHALADFNIAASPVIGWHPAFENLAAVEVGKK